MPSNRYPLIANESWPFLFVLLLLTLLAQFVAGPLVFVICFSVLLIATYMFRDPIRVVPSQPLAVVSPVHGIVTIVEEAKEVRLNTQALRIQITMRPYDIYSVRSPIEGKVIKQWSSSPDKNEPRRHFDFYIKSDEGDDVVTAIRLRDIIRRFHIYLHSGERIGQGQRCGYLYLGGVIDVFVPLESKIQVQVGDYVYSGSSILARLVHSEPASAIQNA